MMLQGLAGRRLHGVSTSKDAKLLGRVIETQGKVGHKEIFFLLIHDNSNVQ